MKNIEEVFIENGFSKKEIQDAMKPKELSERTEDDEIKRGLVMIPKYQDSLKNSTTLQRNTDSKQPTKRTTLPVSVTR